MRLQGVWWYYIHYVMRISYVEPEIEVIELVVERGFAASNEDPEDGGWITND